MNNGLKKPAVCTALFGNSIPVSEFESVSFDFDSFNLKRRVLFTEWTLIPQVKANVSDLVWC